MTLNKDLSPEERRKFHKDAMHERQKQTRTQKIVMWCIFAVAGVLAIISITLLIVNKVPLF